MIATSRLISHFTRISNRVKIIPTFLRSKALLLTSQIEHQLDIIKVWILKRTSKVALERAIRA